MPRYHSHNDNNPLTAIAAFIAGTATGVLACIAWKRIEARIQDQGGAFSAVACDPNDDSRTTAINNALSIVAPSELCVPTKQNTHDKYSVTGYKASDKMKLILVVRTDLGMGKGKIAAQCSHASVGIYSQLLESKQSKLLKQWEDNGQAKICVRVDNEQQMLNVVDAADKMGIPTHVIRDAGHTQVAPDTLTVASIGPAPQSLIDQVTGKLKLLG